MSSWRWFSARVFPVDRGTDRRAMKGGDFSISSALANRCRFSFIGCPVRLGHGGKRVGIILWASVRNKWMHVYGFGWRVQYFHRAPVSLEAQALEYSHRRGRNEITGGLTFLGIAVVFYGQKAAYDGTYLSLWPNSGKERA